MIDFGSYDDVLFWDGVITCGSLTRLSSEHIQIISHITLETTCGEGEDTKEVDVSYLIVDARSPYSIILRVATINTLGAVGSTLYLTLKNMLHDV